MLDALWTFLSNPANQGTLTWIGGGIFVVVGGVWAVVKFFARKSDGGGSKPSVRADNGSVAAGRDISNSPTNIGTHSPKKR